LAHPAPEEKPVEHQVDISGRSFPIIPIYLFKYASQITSLDVSKNLHMDIPLDFLQICSNLTRFILANNDYGILPASLTSIHWLEHLDLSGNKIKNLVSLSTLILLQSLNVTNNLLSTIPTEFGQFQCLSRLSISNNTFTKFPMVVCDITSLTYLDISFNKITEFPHELGQLQNLQSLFAIANRITGILPDCFTQLMRLEELDVRQNMITDLDILSHLPKLERLLVDFNSISIVHCKIQALKTLKMYKNHITLFDFTSSDPNCLTELNLSNCKLSTLPDDLFTHTLGLEKLLLDCNTLNRLPISIGHLGRLVRMSIQSNNLESIPAEIGQLTQLKTLEAQKNNLKWIPEEIWLCESLLTLNCSSNLLETFPEPPLKGDKAPDSPVPNYNPPKYLVNPQNHSHKLRNLFLGDNLLTDDIWSPLSLFLDLRVLNLSFNYLYEIPAHGLCHEHLYELYLSGNQLTSLPADDIERLQYLRVLVVNGNKLQTLPAEIGKLRKLLVLDVGNNVLKYNIANWPYDWNWNWNLGLKYLNLSGNKRLEIQKKMQDYTMKHQDRDLSDFSALTRLRMLGLMDITILGVSTPEEYQDRRVRTTPSEVNGMSYGIADWLGSSDHLSTWDLVMPRYRSNQEESLFGLFDGLARTKTGCLLTKRLNDLLVSHFTRELNATKSDDTIVSAMRRVFLGMEQAIAMDPTVPKEAGASALVCYIAGHRMYVANVGDVQAVISRNNGQVFEITQKHIPLNPSEVSRVRSAGGYVTNSGKLNDALSVSRCFGQLEHVPSINCNPFVSTIDLAENDEFVILATRGLWDKMSYQTAVDIARTEKQDLMTAASKLRDFAISYGATENLMVMVIGVGDKFEKRTKRNRNMGRSNADEEALVVKSKRRGKEEMPGDSVSK
jgi:Leucine-rich repeat (LRR) protein/serine/threonine protein phosphatase PrpC